MKPETAVRIIIAFASGIVTFNVVMILAWFLR
jgi:hypothetical protein